MLHFVKKARALIGGGIFVLLLILGLGITFAAFQDKGKVLGSKFTVGSSDIKLLSDVAGTTDSSNLADELNGPNFDNVTPNWTQHYLLKLVNKGTTPVALTSHARYLTANDPEDLRTILFVDLLPWNDGDGNGLADTGETGTSIGKKSIVKWNTEGFDLGSVEAGQVKGFVLRFSTESISETKQGASGVFDFEFDATSL